MDIGMLWMDSQKWAKPTSLRERGEFSSEMIDPQIENHEKKAGRTLASRVREAAKSYEALYGVKPNLCLVSETQIDGEAVELEGLRLEASATLLPNYFWIGRSGASPLLSEKAKLSLPKSES